MYVSKDLKGSSGVRLMAASRRLCTYQLSDVERRSKAVVLVHSKVLQLRLRVAQKKTLDSWSPCSMYATKVAVLRFVIACVAWRETDILHRLRRLSEKEERDEAADKLKCTIIQHMLYAMMLQRSYLKHYFIS